MFSGKTSELLRRYRRYKISGKSCILIKYKGDIRYDDKMIVTHDGAKIEAEVLMCQLLSEVNLKVSGYDVICIDEIQFYKDAHIFCDLWANKGIIVIASGLSGTFNRTPFPVVSKLIPLAESVVVLDAICVPTTQDASFTKLTIENTTGGTEIIGGSEMYIPVDRKTFFVSDIDKQKYLDTLVNNFIELKNCYDDNEKMNEIKQYVMEGNFNEI
jgi:thymidine kinase